MRTLFGISLDIKDRYQREKFDIEQNMLVGIANVFCNVISVLNFDFILLISCVYHYYVCSRKTYLSFLEQKLYNCLW